MISYTAELGEANDVECTKIRDQMESCFETN